MLKTIILVIHSFVAFFTAFYIFIIPSKFTYDFFFTIFNVFIVLHWILYNNECCLSYYYKKLKNKNYIAGTHTKLDDFSEIIPMNNILHYYTFAFIQILTTVSIYYAAVRTNIMSPLLTILFILVKYVYIFYNEVLGIQLNKLGRFIFGKSFIKVEKWYNSTHIHEIVAPYLNNVVFIIYCIFLIHILYKNKQRIYKFIL